MIPEQKARERINQMLVIESEFNKMIAEAIKP